MEIFTIGHSNHKWDFFLGLLKENSIEMVVDVRAVPYSRFAPWANTKSLGDTLGAEGIEYLWLGDKLGGRPALKHDRAHKVTPADFAGMDEKDSYKQGIRELLSLASRHRTVIMCAEEDPNHCHRELLIGATLRQQGVEVRHIRKNPKS